MYLKRQTLAVGVDPVIFKTINKTISLTKL